MATARKNIVPKAAEEKSSVEAVASEKVTAKKAVPKKVRAVTSVAKKTVTPKAADETVPAKKPGGVFSRAIQGTLFSAGRMVSKTKSLANLKKVVKWKNISASAIDALDSTKRGVAGIGGSIKSAMSAKKIAEETKKVWSFAKEGAITTGEVIKNAVPVEKISEGTKKVWRSTKEGALRASEVIKNSVPLEKISGGTKKVWKSTRKGMSNIRRGTADGLTEIGKSFSAGFQSVREEDTTARVEAIKAGTEALVTTVSKQVSRLSPISRKNSPAHAPVSVKVERPVQRTARKKDEEAKPLSKPAGTAARKPSPVPPPVSVKVEEPAPRTDREKSDERKSRQAPSKITVQKPAPVRRPVIVPPKKIFTEPETEKRRASVEVVDADLEKEVDQIVNEIAEI